MPMRSHPRGNSDPPATPANGRLASRRRTGTAAELPYVSSHKPYASPWLRGFTYPAARSPTERASALALSTALSFDASLALDVAHLCLCTAELPIADRGVERVHLTPPKHPLTGDPDDWHYISDEENRAYFRSQEPISAYRAAVESAKNRKGGAPTTVVVPELALYLPSETPYSDMAGDLAGRVDLSLCIELDDGLHLQILFEAKTNQASTQQRSAVPDWGDELDQPLRYAAIWEENAGLSDEDECRILATIEMGSYREHWLELWQKVRIPGKAQVSQHGPRVAMTDDLQWTTLRQLVKSRPECAGLVRLMLG